MENSLFEKGEDIYKAIEMIIGLDEKNLIEKYKFYCKYLLSLNKDYVNRLVAENYYEECEDYLKELESYTNDGLEKMIDMGNMRLKGI